MAFFKVLYIIVDYLIMVIGCALFMSGLIVLLMGMRAAFRKGVPRASSALRTGLFIIAGGIVILAISFAMAMFAGAHFPVQF